MADTRRIFVGFAVEDKRHRDRLRGQSRLGDTAIEYTDYAVKEPWSSAWKTSCRQRVRGCHGIIALLSKNTRDAEGARWEIKCAVEEGVPVLGVHIFKDDRYTPPEIAGQQVIPWTWDGIRNFIKEL